MSAFHYERFPPIDTDTDNDNDHDDGDLDGYDSSTGSDPLQRRQRPKIRRCRLTAHQLQSLNQVFEQDYQPSMETRIALGMQLGMETKQVSAWFQNKRQKLKNAPATSFPSSSLPPPSSLPHDFDSHSSRRPEYRHQSIYHSRDLPPLDYNRYHQQPYLSFARPPHHQPLAVLDHVPNYIDRYPPPLTHPYHQDQYDMKPTTSTFKLSNPNKILNPVGSVGSLDRIMTRSTSSRSRSASTESTYTNVTDFMPHVSTKGLQPNPLSIGAKKEPFDESHHTEMLRIPTPPPEAVQSSPSMKKATTIQSATNRRTSTRARSARLAVSPIMGNNRHLSTTGSPASSHNDGQPKRLTRSRMSSSQRAYLHSIFEENPDPSMSERQVIANKLGVQTGKITNWFRNLRQSVRRGKLLDAKLASTRATTVDSKAEEEEEEVRRDMEVDEGEDAGYTDDEVRGSPCSVPPSPALASASVAPTADIVPGKGAYSTHSLIAASEYAALHSSPEIEVEEDDDEEEEEAHEALTPYHSPESKLSHSFGPGSSTVNSNTPENILSSPTPSNKGRITLPSISITLAQSEEKKQEQQEQKFKSAVEDALLLLHFRENCDVRDIHHGVVVGRPSSPQLY